MGRYSESSGFEKHHRGFPTIDTPEEEDEGPCNRKLKEYVENFNKKLQFKANISGNIIPQNYQVTQKKEGDEFEVRIQSTKNRYDAIIIQRAFYNPVPEHIARVFLKMISEQFNGGEKEIDGYNIYVSHNNIGEESRQLLIAMNNKIVVSFGIYVLPSSDFKPDITYTLEDWR